MNVTPFRLASFATLAALAILLSALTGCAITSHAVRPSDLGVSSSASALLAVLDQPGPVTVETVNSADWAVSLHDLLNLDHPRARAAGLTDHLEPVQVYFHAIRHPTRGLFLIDTGVERARRDAPDRAALRGVVASYLSLGTMKVGMPLADWLDAHPGEPVRGVFMTHLRPDHVTGMADVPAGTPIYTGAGEAADSDWRYAALQPQTDRALERAGAVRGWWFPWCTHRRDGSFRTQLASPAGDRISTAPSHPRPQPLRPRMTPSRPLLALLLASAACSATAAKPPAPAPARPPAPPPAPAAPEPPPPPPDPRSTAPLPPPTATDPASGHVCTEIVGLDNIALTFDGGKTLVRSRPHPPNASGAIVGVVALGTPYTLAAVGYAGPPAKTNELFLSVDGGCHWTSRGPVDARHIIAGRDGVAYAWNHSLYAISVSSVRNMGKMPAWESHLAIDGANPRHLLAIGGESEGDVFDSTDAGETWQPVGGSVLRPRESASLAVDPSDMNHVMYTPSPYEAQVHVGLSWDHGRTWTPSTADGLGGTLRLEPGGQTAWSFGARIYRSTDGGRSFSKVATPMPSDQGVVLLAGAQPNPNEVVLAAWENDHERRSRFLIRFNLRSFQWTTQLLPLDPGKLNDGSTTASEVVTSATFVPGETSGLCLGIEQRGGTEPLY